MSWIFFVKSLSSVCESQYWREQTIQVSLLQWGTWRRFPGAWLSRRGSGLKPCFFQSWPKWVILRARKCTSPHFPLILHLWTLLWWEDKEILLKSCSSYCGTKVLIWIVGFLGVLWGFSFFLRFQALISLPHHVNFAQDCSLHAVFSITVNIINYLI